MKKVTTFLVTLFCITTLFVGSSCSPENNGPVKYAITMANDGNGAATAGVNGEVVVKAEAGATVTITATAAEGYLFEKWVVVSGGVTLIGDIANIQTFTMPANKVSIKAEFKAIPDDIFTAITDPKFKAFCQRYDADGDGKLSYTETQEVTKMDASRLDIASLSGIEYFTSLTVLYCSYSQLTSLDVTKNTKLTYLDCYNNQLLTTLDVSKNTALTELYCYNNELLTSLDVSKNTKLIALNCNTNQLTSLDVTKNTALTYISCDNNKLPTLDVSLNTALDTLSCYSNKLESLDVIKNTALKYLDCNDNQLKSLDLSKNTKLTTLLCDQNPSLTKIFVWSDFDIIKPTNSIEYIRKDDGAKFEHKP